MQDTYHTPSSGLIDPRPSMCCGSCREVVDHPKALYRRATAHAMLGNYEEAEQDFLRTKEVGPLSFPFLHVHSVPPGCPSPGGSFYLFFHIYRYIYIYIYIYFNFYC
jgi:hypothetical protein